MKREYFKCIDLVGIEKQKTLKNDYDSDIFCECQSNILKLLCVNCNSFFYTKNSTAKYCSYRCRNDVFIIKRAMQREKNRDVRCYSCYKDFKSKRNDTTFCSNACRQKYYRKKLSEKKRYEKYEVECSKRLKNVEDIDMNPNWAICDSRLI
ncbi:MAG: hypothetical protein KKB09_07180 [Nanoarchaeota archaeon]|nr:hypothetical protein [Nanoarchaeota archaeon]